MDLCERFQIVENWRLHVVLYKNVENCSELKQQAIRGEINAALLSPSMIIEPFQLQAAALKAVHSYIHKKVITKTLHSELIFCLSPSKNISSAFHNFGITNNDRVVLVAMLSEDTASAAASDALNAICSQVSGEAVSLSCLPEFSSIERIKKVYGVTEAELKISTLLDAVVTKMASRDFL